MGRTATRGSLNSGIILAYLYCMTQTFSTGSELSVDGGTVLV
jgi:hypothetical protein